MNSRPIFTSTDIATLKYFEDFNKRYSGTLHGYVSTLQSNFNKYTKVSCPKQNASNIMSDYELAFEAQQKAIDWENSIKARNLAVESLTNREILKKTLKEFQEKLKKIEADQQKKQKFIVILSKVLKYANKQFQMRKVNDKGIQISMKSKDNLGKYKAANERFLYID